MPYIIRFAGPSNTGKTTLIQEIATQLCKHELRIGILKHGHHPPTATVRTTNTAPKQQIPDSLRWRQSLPNVDTLYISNEHIEWNSTITSVENPTKPRECIERYFASHDLLLIEGWRDHVFPTILVYHDHHHSNTYVDIDWNIPRNIIGLYGSGAQRYYEKILQTVPHTPPIYTLDNIVSHIEEHLPIRP